MLSQSNGLVVTSCRGHHLLEGCDGPVAVLGGVAGGEADTGSAGLHQVQ